MQCTKTSLGKTTESTIKVLENAHTKNWWLTIEAETKIADFLLYVSIKQRNIKNWGIYHYLCRVLTILVRNKYAFKGKKRDYKWSHMSWDTSASQIHDHSNHLNLSEWKKDNLQSTEKKKCTNAYCLWHSPFYWFSVPIYNALTWKGRPFHPWRTKRFFP